MGFWFSVESILVGLVGRPILRLVRYFRWPILGLGIYLNGITTIDPATGATESHHTIVPAIVGFLLFCIGSTVKRYDELAAEVNSQSRQSP